MCQRKPHAMWTSLTHPENETKEIFLSRRTTQRMDERSGIPAGIRKVRAGISDCPADYQRQIKKKNDSGGISQKSQNRSGSDFSVGRYECAAFNFSSFPGGPSFGNQNSNYCALIWKKLRSGEK